MRGDDTGRDNHVHDAQQAQAGRAADGANGGAHIGTVPPESWQTNESWGESPMVGVMEVHRRTITKSRAVGRTELTEDELREALKDVPEHWRWMGDKCLRDMRRDFFGSLRIPPELLEPKPQTTPHEQMMAHVLKQAGVAAMELPPGYPGHSKS